MVKNYQSYLLVKFSAELSFLYLLLMNILRKLPHSSDINRDENTQKYQNTLKELE